MISDHDEMEMICGLLAESKNIAVYGLSSDISKTSRQIADFLVEKGFNVVGVNPSIDSAGKIDVYPNLKSIPHKIDIVNVFRRSEDIPKLIDDVLAVNPKALWLQQGIRNDNAVKSVSENGIITIQDKCITVYYNLCRAFKK